MPNSFFFPKTVRQRPGLFDIFYSLTVDLLLSSHQMVPFLFKIMLVSLKQCQFSLNPHFEFKKMSLDDFFNDDLSARDREP